MISKVVSVSFRLGLSATRTTLSLSTKLAGVAAGAAFDAVRSQFTSHEPTSASSTSGPSAAPARPATPEARSAAPATPDSPEPTPDRTLVVEEEVVAPEDQPDTPLTHDDAVAKTVDDEDEVVAEFAESGAEDGAGAQLHMEEPWEGYDGQSAETVTAQIADADAAQLAVLELYEGFNQGRKTVLEAAAQRLAELSPPNAA
jgi:hypothetical protein